MKKLFILLMVILLIALVVAYIIAAINNQKVVIPQKPTDYQAARHKVVAILGATGTIGDGILKAAIDDPNTKTIYVITRRESHRITKGAQQNKLNVIMHQDYDEYTEIADIFPTLDAVYWAIGRSSRGLDEQTYKNIHQALPLAFLETWAQSAHKADASFHYVSGAGASVDSSMMWAREKARAESMLAQVGKRANIRVISYRPSFILPTSEHANIGQGMLFTLFSPIGLATRSRVIGEAMLDVSARGDSVPSGAVIENDKLNKYSASICETY